MKIWLLSKKENIDKYSFSRFKGVATELKLDFSFVHPEDFDIIATAEGKKSIHYQGKDVDFPDCLIPRMGSGTTYFGLAVIRHFEKNGVLVLNSSEAVANAKDKLATIQNLVANNIPTPKTMLAKFPFDIEFIKKEFSYPIIVKTVSGSLGKGIFLCNNAHQLQDIMDLIEVSKEPNVNVILQEFISSSKGRDLRVIIIGGRPIGAILRKAKRGKFKANYSAGGSAESFPLNPAIEWLAVESAHTLGLEIAGVDILFDGNNYKVCEVNSAPHFEGFEKATGINIPKAIFKYIELKLGKRI